MEWKFSTLLAIIWIGFVNGGYVSDFYDESDESLENNNSEDSFENFDSLEFKVDIAVISPNPENIQKPEGNITDVYVPVEYYDDSETLRNATLSSNKDLCSVQEEFVKKISEQYCLRGPKGDAGPKGHDGFGLQGQKGDKGDSIVGPPGVKGDIGPSGVGVKGDKGDCSCSGQMRVDKNTGKLVRAGGAIIYNNLGELQKIDRFTKVGAIAYVKSERTFFGRIKAGWAPFLMGEPIGYKKADDRQQILNFPNRHQKRSSSKYLSAIKKHNLKLISLNEPWPGNMNGIDFINYQCQKEAYESGIPGTFRAFLSSPKDKGTDLISLVKHQDDSIVNLKSETLYPTWRSVFSRGSKLLREKVPHFIYSFNGQNVVEDVVDHWKENLIWHGTFETGRGSYTGSCKSWTSSNSDSKGLASDFLFHHILSQEKQSCNSSLIVLCIEVPSDLIRKFVLEVRDLPPNSVKSVKLSHEEHKQVLRRYDDEWSVVTDSKYSSLF